MQAWSPNPGYPVRLRICADARITPTNIQDDQTWDLSFLPGEKSALALETSFGLRARLMRLYFLYKDVGRTAIGPEKQFSSPRFLEIFPNYIKTQICPCDDIVVTIEYYAHASDAILGRITIKNTSLLTRYIQTDAFCKLIPIGQGKQAGVQQQGINKVFSGHCGDIFPCFYITGGPEHNFGQTSSLRLSAELASQGSKTYTWSMVSSHNLDESYLRAKQLSAFDWDGTVSYLELLNKSEVLEIETGNLDWDRLLLLSQIKAFSLLISGEGRPTPRMSFHKSRNPDQGYIPQIGKFQTNQITEQSSLDAIHLANIILPAGIKTIKQITDGFFPLSIDQQENRNEPVPSSQKPIPPLQLLLATLTLISHGFGHSDIWCMNKIPRLRNMIESWFDDTHDRDQDGLPEAQNIFQYGNDEISLFTNNEKESQNAKPAQVESPQIGAFLFNDINSLQLFLLSHGTTVENERLEYISERLKTQVKLLFDPAESSFFHRHVFTHQSGECIKLITFSGVGEYDIHQVLTSPQALVVHYSSNGLSPRAGSITIFGSIDGRPVVETIPTNHCPGDDGDCAILSINEYLTIEKIVVKDIPEGDFGWIGTIDYVQKDLTSYLPVWAGILEKEQAVEILEKMVQIYCRPVGLVTHISSPAGKSDPSVSMLWNGIFIEALLNYGLFQNAFSITQNLLNGASQALAHTGCLGGKYHPETGSIVGGSDTLEGLFPITVFLKLLGIQKLSLDEVVISGFNPFSRIIVVKYRTISITCSKNETRIIQNNKPPVVIDTQGTHRVIF